MMEWKVSSHLDYLTVSFHKVDDISQAILMPAIDAMQIDDEMKPFKHYDEAYRLRCGAIVNLSNSTKQGARFDAGGQALEALRESGETDASILRAVSWSEKLNNTKRIDYCFNLHDATGCHVTDCLDHLDAGDYKTRFSLLPERHGRHGSKKGQTLRFGSKDADNQVIIYDKAAELKLLNQAWLRVELKTRRLSAAGVRSDAMRQGNDLASVARGRIKRYLQFPRLEWYNALLAGDTVEPSPTRHKKNKWRWWMEHQVFNSIKLRACDPEAREFIREWQNRIDELMENCEDE